MREGNRERRRKKKREKKCETAREKRDEQRERERELAYHRSVLNAVFVVVTCLSMQKVKKKCLAVKPFFMK